MGGPPSCTRARGSPSKPVHSPPPPHSDSEGPLCPWPQLHGSHTAETLANVSTHLQASTLVHVGFRRPSRRTRLWEEGGEVGAAPKTFMAANRRGWGLRPSGRPPGEAPRASLGTQLSRRPGRRAGALPGACRRHCWCGPDGRLPGLSD